MKINEVEAAVGVTKKNIRFYEEEGLISPSREPGNGYRSYSQADVERLRRIKLLRKLDGAPMVFGPSSPNPSRCSTEVFPYFSRTMRTSSCVSEIWVIRCRPYLSASRLPRRRFSGDTV